MAKGSLYLAFYQQFRLHLARPVLWVPILETAGDPLHPLCQALTKGVSVAQKIAHTVPRSILSWYCWTYADLHQGTGRLAAALQKQGLRVGDRLVCVLPKSVAGFWLYLACLRVGVVYVPLNPEATNTELQRYVADASPVLVVVAESDGPAATFAAKTLTLAALLQQAATTAPMAEIAHMLSSDTPAVMLYTSGTTGRPKGVPLTHANLSANGLALQQQWQLRADDVILHALPLFHVHGLLFACAPTLLAGGALLWLPRFKVTDVWACLPGATVFMGVPTYYQRLLQAPGLSEWDAADRLRLCISGSAPLTARLRAAIQAHFGCPLLERYGMTETGVIASLPAQVGVAKQDPVGCVGTFLPGQQGRIRSLTGQPVAVGDVGQVEVRGASVFLGYWQQPQVTAAVLTEDGFFQTGDLGYCDAQGRLILVGRCKELIITGGMNVYPNEVVQALEALPAVQAAAVIGVPDADYGECVVAVLEVTKTVTATEILTPLRSVLSGYKRPKAIYTITQLPRNAMGKLQLNQLQAFVAETDPL